MENKKQTPAERAAKNYSEIIPLLKIDAVVSKYGEPAVRRALNRYLNNARAKSRLLKQKAAAEEALKTVEQKLRA